MIHGAASSSLQSEGVARTADWYAWERAGHVPPSRDGNGLATQYVDDAALLARNGLGAWRITLEWARLEPQQTGSFDPIEVARYRAILSAIGEAGMEAWACLAHTTLPGWFSEDERGFLDEKGGRWTWPAHVDRIAETFGDLVDGWVTFHEPVKYAMDAYLWGQLPPNRRDGDEASMVMRNLLRADAAAAKLLRSPRAPVASSHWLPPVIGIDTSPEARKAAAAAEEMIWNSWWDYDDHDWLGVSCSYGIGVSPDGGFHSWPKSIQAGPMGWSPWPDGLSEGLHRIAEVRSGRPLLLFTGAWDTDEKRRLETLQGFAAAVDEAVDDKVPIQQTHWYSAIDGYEGRQGFDVHSGLFDRDRNPTGIAALSIPASGETPAGSDPDLEKNHDGFNDPNDAHTDHDGNDGNDNSPDR